MLSRDGGGAFGDAPASGGGCARRSNVCGSTPHALLRLAWTPEPVFPRVESGGDRPAFHTPARAVAFPRAGATWWRRPHRLGWPCGSFPREG
ncbi:hypothetical protein BRADI_2g31953v3 [Brachypodium distachyon]|uniref:Uncharacterized protein n=1 Tax=Brachypodium distachyon TaxID=15368 RepID=A0A0Q3G948_BRADI|nr:hypothetical protein BRADI_2g31953v3 [Brachypodium distachyon]